MSGLFGTFNIVKRGMQAQQTALNVVAHNVANANTEGYSVQRADLKTTQPFGMPSLTTSAEPGQLGTGVQVASITRSRNEFLDYQIRKEKGTLGKFEAKEQFLSEIETIFMEPSETGIATSLGKFWDSWSQLSNTPEPNSTARTLVAQNADALAKSINHIYSQLSELEINAGDLMQQQLFEVDSILTQIQELNVQIKAVVIAGKTPNDLMDRRDLLLDSLSNRFGYTVDKTDFEGIKITAKIKDENGNTKSKVILSDAKIENGLAYINKISSYDDNGTTKYKMELYINGDPNNPYIIDNLDSTYINQYQNKHIAFYNKEDFKNKTLDKSKVSIANFDTGSLDGYESIKTEVNSYKNQLNNLTRVLAISVNTLHSNSVDGTGIDFFNKEAENGLEPAGTIKVNDLILNEPKNINAGKIIGANSPEGNGERALLINQLRYTRMNLTGINSRQDFVNNVGIDLDETSPKYLKMTGDKNGITIDNYFKSTIANLGVLNQDAKRYVVNQEALLTQLETRKESISGVSLDEEITNMIQFQRSYQANAKMISVIDELLDVVVNGLKR